MAVNRNIEWKVEAAWMARLLHESDITDTVGTRVKRWTDTSAAATLPCVVVHCSPVPNAPEAPRGVLYDAAVEIGAWTEAIDDSDREDVRNLIGAIRDVTQAATLNDSLTASATPLRFTGVDVFGSGAEDTDESNIHSMSLTLECFIHDRS